MINSGNMNFNFFSTSPYSDIVIRTRATLSRNLVSHPFSWKNNISENSIIQKKIEDNLIELEKNNFLKKYSVYESNNTKLNQFKDFELIHKNYDKNGKNIYYISENLNASILLNIGDHITINSITTGFNIYQTFENIKKISENLEERLDFAFDFNYGYLSADINSSGTGLTFEVLVYLPAIDKSNYFTSLSSMLENDGLTIKKYVDLKIGENLKESYFLISTKSVLGKNEEEILTNFSKTILRVVNIERIKRKDAPTEFISQVELNYNNSIEFIKNSSSITYQQAFNILSSIRIATMLKYCDYSFHILNAIFYLISDTLIAMVYGEKNGNKEYLNNYRANFFKKVFLENNLEELCLKE